MTAPPKPLEERRRRALYRAKHRGTKEMDFLLGRYAEGRLAAMDAPEMDEFEQFLALPDPYLQVWLLSGAGNASSAFTPLVGRIRTFHGLVDPAGAA